MMRHLGLLCFFFVFVPVEAAPLDRLRDESDVVQAAPKINGRLQEALSSRLPGTRQKIWVYLADKGPSSRAGYAAAPRGVNDHLTPRARRRLAMRGGGKAGWADMPVHRPYVERISALGGEIRHLSRWHNAVSVSVDPEGIRRLAELPFVLKIEAVNRLRRPRPVPAEGRGPSEAGSRPRRLGANQLDYGPSFVQVNQLQVPALHDLGLSGRGVLVALFDTGFNLDHVAFDSLRTRVAARRDFIEDHMGHAGFAFDTHGTQVLSAIGGFAPGQLVGPAYGADYLLASTEAVAFEAEIEEDWWVAALEWADSLGVDVISSSLGYVDWYTFEDMDGETALITRAAAMAADRGIVVVNAMGNLGSSPFEKMTAPADAEKVISVGAVDASGRRAAFSSLGPTYDGRIKPDVMAMGQRVYTVDPSSVTGYTRGDGTSFSAPLVAGVAALLLEAFPHWTPQQVQRALRQTAGQAAAPDTLNGYGIVRAEHAAMTEARGVVRSFTGESGPSGVFLVWTAGLEINLLSYRIDRRIRPDGIFERLASTPVSRSGEHPPGSNAYDFTDTAVQPGTSYEYRLQPVGPPERVLTAEPVTIRVDYASDPSDGPAAVLYPNAPNPFSGRTRIRYELSEPVHVTLTIYDLLGRKLRVLVDEAHGRGRYTRTWDGRDEDGRVVPTGLYLYRMNAGVLTAGGKMLLLR